MNDPGPKREPRYRAIADELMRDIAAGRYPIGSILPPEVELCERFAVSRFTMREALRRLHELGMVSRRRGAGTRVEASERLGPYVQSLRSPDELLQYPPETRITVVRTGTIRADRDLARLLHCRTGQEWARISGVRRIERGGPPICWTDLYVLPAYAGVADLIGGRSGPVYRLIEQAFGETVARVNLDIFAGAVAPELAEPLKTEPGTPALFTVRRYTGKQDRVFEVSVSIHPSGRFSYAMEMQRQWQPAG